MYPSKDDRWQRGDAKLGNDLTRLSTSPATDLDFELLPLVVSAALAGIDVAQRYPAFHDRLLACPALAEAFLDALSALQEPSPPTWQQAWRLSLAQLQSIFFGPALNFSYRSGDVPAEGFRLVLLSRQSQDEEHKMRLALSIQVLESPTRVRPIASLALQPEPAGLHLHLQWGSYQAMAQVDAGGQAVFPDLDLGQVLNASQQQVTADLSLTLHAASF